MSKIVTLVVPPGGGGVRDYSDRLAHGLKGADFDVNVFSWLSGDPGAIDAHVESSDCIILQYSGYGFAKRGAPLWILKYLKSKRSKIRRLGVFFHELYAFGPPWGSAFWLSPVQQHVAASLARTADFWLTNRDGARQWLARQAPAAPNATMPVISNVGELQAYLPKREKSAIVFGSGGRRSKTWLAAGSAVFEWAVRNGVQLHDVGAPINDESLNDLLRRHGVLLHGRLDELAINRLMSSAMYGLIAYPVIHVAKSGVFAAYCAHGVTPLLIADEYPTHDGLISGEQFQPASILQSSTFDYDEKVAEHAWNWYQCHSQKVHVAVSREFILRRNGLDD